MKKTSFATMTGASVAAIALALAPLSPASAASTAAWGVWDLNILTAVNTETVTFGSSSLPDATFTISGTYTTAEVLNVDDGDEWFTAETPIGAVFGANGPSATNNFLKIESTTTTTDLVTLTVTFASPTKANDLGVAVSDLDSDEVTVSATDANGNALTGAQLVGTASPDAFNWCNVANSPGGCTDTDTPNITVNASDVFAAGAQQGTDGSTAWFQPSVGVKTITYVYKNDDTNTQTSTVRFWLAQKESALPNTGVSASSMLGMFGFGAALLAAGALIVVRRRRA